MLGTGMMHRALPSASVAVIAASLVAVCVAACGEPSPNYGPATGLNRGYLPSPTSTSTTAPPPAEDSGAPSGQDSGTMMTTTAPPSDSGASCAVSWSTTIYPLLTGAWGCSASACHGGGTSPSITNNAASTVYTTLTNFKGADSTSRPYILPGSTDPTKSTFLCSLTSPTCGTLMPLGATVGNPVTTADVATLTTWIECGSPEN